MAARRHPRHVRGGHQEGLPQAGAEAPPGREPGRNTKAAEERFKTVSEAYSVLSDEEKRKAYDEFGEVSLAAGFDADAARRAREGFGARFGGGSGGFGQGGPGPGFEESFSYGDLDDLLGDVFAKRGWQRGGAARGPHRGRRRLAASRAWRRRRRADRRDRRRRSSPRSPSGAPSETAGAPAETRAPRVPARGVGVEARREGDLAELVVGLPLLLIGGSRVGLGDGLEALLRALSPGWPPGGLRAKLRVGLLDHLLGRVAGDAAPIKILALLLRHAQSFSGDSTRPRRRFEAARTVEAILDALVVAHFEGHDTAPVPAPS